MGPIKIPSLKQIAGVAGAGILVAAAAGFGVARLTSGAPDKGDAKVEASGRAKPANGASITVTCQSGSITMAKDHYDGAPGRDWCEGLGKK